MNDANGGKLISQVTKELLAKIGDEPPAGTIALPFAFATVGYRKEAKDGTVTWESLLDMDAKAKNPQDTVFFKLVQSSGELVSSEDIAASGPYRSVQRYYIAFQDEDHDYFKPSEGPCEGGKDLKAEVVLDDGDGGLCPLYFSFSGMLEDVLRVICQKMDSQWEKIAKQVESATYKDGVLTLPFFNLLQGCINMITFDMEKDETLSCMISSIRVIGKKTHPK